MRVAGLGIREDGDGGRTGIRVARRELQETEQEET